MRLMQYYASNERKQWQTIKSKLQILVCWYELILLQMYLPDISTCENRRRSSSSRFYQCFMNVNRFRVWTSLYMKHCVCLCVAAEYMLCRKTYIVSYITGINLLGKYITSVFRETFTTSSITERVSPYMPIIFRSFITKGYCYIVC